MPALTIKNIPDDLYRTLKQTAEIHRRSINSEVIFCLENALMPKKKLTPTEQLARVESLRSAIAANVITIDEISNAIDDGRP
ncbi:MAG: Arc family DNA-binding protein [Methylobacter sp.]|nr:Arc family DNA-binding protein [Methylobacter sp.]